MRRNLLLIGAGLAAFLVAGVAMSLIQMTVSALVPGRSDDPPGKLETPVDQPTKTTQDQQSSTITAENVSPDTNTQQQVPAPTPPPPVDVIQEGANDFPQPQPMPQPPPPVRGPGNFNAPQPYYQPSGPAGPGNL